MNNENDIEMIKVISELRNSSIERGNQTKMLKNSPTAKEEYYLLSSVVELVFVSSTV